ncbi:MAG: hypothetical protein KDK64_01920 [Chlamydiia bacterium]|nr:hypothetical protein [Chlamydiia bacterium]
MTQGTFDPACSQIYAIEYANNMVFALINEENNLASSMNVASDKMNSQGRNELVKMEDIYNGMSSGYKVYDCTNIVHTNTAAGTNYGVWGDWKTFSDPGWGSTDDNEETQAASQVCSQYNEMIQNGYQSFNSMLSSMSSQASTNSGVAGQFSSDQSSNIQYGASLLASNLA